MPTARISELVPMLICEDVQSALAFYTDVLGFEVRDRMNDVGRSGWASLQCGGARIVLRQAKLGEGGRHAVT